jgi:hypothetical protein
MRARTKGGSSLLAFLDTVISDLLSAKYVTEDKVKSVHHDLMHFFLGCLETQITSIWSHCITRRHIDNQYRYYLSDDDYSVTTGSTFIRRFIFDLNGTSHTHTHTQSTIRRYMAGRATEDL